MLPVKFPQLLLDETVEKWVSEPSKHQVKNRADTTHIHCAVCSELDALKWMLDNWSSHRKVVPVHRPFVLLSQ